MEMALGCELTSVTGNRGVNYKKLTARSPKTNKEKKINCFFGILFFRHSEFMKIWTCGHLETYVI
jgi:hypothetical protein